MRPLRAVGGGLFGLFGALGEAGQLTQHLRARQSILGIARLQGDRFARGRQRTLRVALGRQQSRFQPVRAGQLRIDPDRLLQVAHALLGLAVEVRLGPEHKCFGGDRLEHDLGHFHRRLARRLTPLEGEHHAALGKRLTEDVPQLVGDQHRANLGQLELLGHDVGRKGPIETNHDRLHPVLHKAHLHLLERLDRVKVHELSVSLGDLLWRPPRFLDVGQRAHLRRDPVEAGRLGGHPAARLRIGNRRERLFGRLLELLRRLTGLFAPLSRDRRGGLAGLIGRRFGELGRLA